MQVFRITCTPKPDVALDEDALALIWAYLGCLYTNGQILWDYEVVQADAAWQALVTLPEDDALDEQYRSGYVQSDHQKVAERFELSMEPVGRNMNQGSACGCEDPSWYMLYTDHTLTESPVVCGDCGKTVPLYKLPYILGEAEHFSVLSWQRAYRSVDALFMHGLSDRFTLRQMRHPQSRLSLEGRDICRAFEQAVGKPFYYYLFHYERTRKVCPVCAADWWVEEEKTFVDYRCEDCRLVADKRSKMGLGTK